MASINPVCSILFLKESYPVYLVISFYFHLDPSFAILVRYF